MKRLRSFFAVLLLLALPLQALASAVMVPRIGSHDGTAHAAWVDALHSHANADDDVRVDANLPHPGAGPHHHEGSSNEPASHSSTCSVCGDCCCPISILGSALLVPGLAVDHGDVISFPTHRIPSPAPDRLDRPPRSTLV